ncbi:hypothetical protein [Pseudoduganella sp. OTU4001]|uniref:hypothetical protein n=1 Tax=Pseudoduganella sp. OTU4001 TaxID=3043854 RepID=UPI00313E3FDD
MRKDLKTLADATIAGIKSYVEREASVKIRSLEQRVIDLEERLRAVDGQKAVIRNTRNSNYQTKDMRHDAE